MHRSGTSMITRLLHLCGLYLGEEKDLVSADPHNLEGYWEHNQFLMINEELLAALGGGWDFPPRVAAGWENSHEISHIKTKASELIQQFAAHDHWGWKDPRNSLTLPFWQQITPSMKMVVCVRNPLEVSNSLFKRNYFSSAMAFNLWLEYNQRILASLTPENGIITHYDSYFQDPYSELKRILGFLDIHVSDGQIVKSIDTLSIPLHHHQSTSLDLMRAAPQTVLKLYQRMCDESGMVLQPAVDDNAARPAALIKNSPEDGASSEIVRLLTLELLEKNQILSAKDQFIQAQLTEKQKLVENLKEQLAGQAAQIIEKDSIIQTLTGRLAEYDTQIASLHQSVQALESQVAEGEVFAQSLLSKITERDGKLAELTGSRAWKIALFVRKIRVLLLPPNSYRVRVLRTLINIIPSLFSRIRKSGEFEADAALVVSSRLFDRQWYLKNNPDVARSNVNPLHHYLENGGVEGRDPGPNFSSNWYLENYEDVRERGINPLLHYLKYGRQEGRSIQRSHNIFSLKPLSPGARILQKIRNRFKHPLSFLNIPYTRSTGSTAQPVEPVDLERLHYRPLISVLIPTYNTPVKYLVAAVNSVRNQLYPHWEICICDDASSSRATLEELRKIAGQDARITVLFSQENTGISGATNKAAEIAKGAFFALLDHDDELTANALYEMVLALNQDQGIEILYSDQDKIDKVGVTDEPFFKPDWSPELLRSVMYIGHLLVVKRDVFKRANGLNSEFDGVQDFEFMLRVSEMTSKIKHIPQVLYHWRKIPGSVAFGLDEKGDKIETLQVKAVNEHFSRLGIHAIAAQHPRHRHRIFVQPGQRENHPLVSIIILTKDMPEHIGRSLQSIFQKTVYPNYEVVVVDNGTTDRDALQILREHPVKRVEFNEKFNYARCNNLGARNSQGEFLIFLNNDTEVLTPNWIEQLLFYCEFADVGAVGPLLVYPDRTVQHAGVVLGLRGTADHIMRHFPNDSDGYAGSLSSPREVSAVTGACLMIKRNDFLMEGGFQEYYDTHYQDVDLCLHLRAKGKRNLYVPHAVLIHYESSSRGKFYDHLDKGLLLDIWGDLIAKGDPYYNPNFSLDNQNFYVVK